MCKSSSRILALISRHQTVTICTESRTENTHCVCTCMHRYAYNSRFYINNQYRNTTNYNRDMLPSFANIYTCTLMFDRERLLSHNVGLLD